MLCATMISTHMVWGFTDETSPSQTTPSTEEAVQTETVYTLHLTHVFRFTVDGKDRNVSATETLELNEADFKDGICDLTRFVYDAKQLTVTEAKPLSVDDFNENHEGGARIVYAVNNGWKIARTRDTAEEGTVLRDVFKGKLDDYTFIPADVIWVNLNYKYSNTGGMAGQDAASPDAIEVIPTKQNDGTYKISWDLPTVNGFRIVLDPTPLNQYLVNPPTGNESAAELKAALDCGDFDVDIVNNTVYYNQENPGGNTHPTYNNRYSTEYNASWNSARSLTTDDYMATAVGDNNNHGANPLENPKLEITLTEDQLDKVLKGTVNLNMTIYYRRNATWYTVNHWVPEGLSGLNTDQITNKPGSDKKTVDSVNYIRMDQETLQGRVGAMTRAIAKTNGIYEELESIDFSQKLIENTDTAVDIFYKAAESYRVIFDTNYTYIPRQQVPMNGNVDFTNVSQPKRTGYTFAGWRYLKKNAVATNGEYPDNQYIDVDQENGLKIDADLLQNAKLLETGGVLALHLYPKWTPATTQVRVILWTENLTGLDDVQATAAGGKTADYDDKYANYQNAPVTHTPQLGTTDSHYSNVHSFTVNVETDSSLLNSSTLINDIQNKVNEEFKTCMGQASGIDVNQFYTQNTFEIVHEEDGEVNYNVTKASADGKTMIYVYFTRNIYTLQFHYYGTVNGVANSVALNTKGYSYDDSCLNADGSFNFNFTGNVANNDQNFWQQPTGTGAVAANTVVPETITIKAKYGANLNDVWPSAQVDEVVHGTATNSGSRVADAQMISWSATAGKYRDDAQPDAEGSTHAGEPTIMGVYGAMSAEIIAAPANPNTTHHLVAYWNDNGTSYYRYNHCIEVPDLDRSDLDEAQIVSISDNGDTSNEHNKLYLVPTDNEKFAKYDFNDLMRVSYENRQIKYDDSNGMYYAVRYNESNKKCYAVARRVDIVSRANIQNQNQNPSARLHLTRVSDVPDHSTEHVDTDGACWVASGSGYNANPIGNADNLYDLYFYYNRDRYTITYMVPTNQENATESEYTLGTISLPYGAMVTEEKYSFNLDYKDKNNNNTKYSWTPAAQVINVCPDRAENGTAKWNFKGWALGPAGVNMQWIVNDDTQTEAQAGDDFAIEGNMRLYAIWEAPTYTVTFHLDGGTVTSGQQTKVDIPANTRYSINGIIPRPFKDGYTLSGWYESDENGNTLVPQQEFDFDQAITDNKHVVAKWDAVSTETFNYTVYYVTDKLNDGDHDRDTIQIDKDQIVTSGGSTYYVLGKREYKDQVFIANSSLNLSATIQNGYIPKETNKILTLGGDSNVNHNVIFYYDKMSTNKHSVYFVEAGTEQNDTQKVIKSIEVKADQTVVTPKSAITNELVEMGYALVNKTNAGTYERVSKAEDMTWLDKSGNIQNTTTLKGDSIPDIIIYLVQPIPYTITYRNADGLAKVLDDALKDVTAKSGTSVADKGDKNPTQYTTEDQFTLNNPTRVYDADNNKWYQFSHWSLGNGTTVQGNNTKTEFNPLNVAPGTVGNLTFIANWKEISDTGSLVVSKDVTGNAAETDRDFRFTVTLSDKTISGMYGDMEFKAGVASFTLKHGETKTATALPAGITYTVKEDDYSKDGYVVSKTGDTGTIIKDKVVKAAFTNTKDITVSQPNNPQNPGMTDTSNIDNSKPSTGDTTNIEKYMVVFVISGLVLVILCVLKKKKVHKKR